MADREITFKIGDVIYDKSVDKKYRIVATGRETTFVQMDTSKLLLTWISTNDLYENALKNEILFIEEDNDKLVIDASEMADSTLEQFNKDKKVCEMIRNHFAPTYSKMSHNKKDSFIADCIKEYGYSKPTLLKKLRVYFQSGFNETSLIDKRSLRYKQNEYSTENGSIKKTKECQQRLSDEDKKNFEKYFKQYKNSKYTRMIDAYRDMLNDCYRIITENDDGSITYGATAENAPSLRQFRKYIHDNLTPQQKDAIIMKKRDIRNNKRLLTGSASTGVSYPGECVEIDEVDMPVSLVSRYDPNQTVGRANVYMMIDVLTHIILCVGVAYNQNSYVGLTNMFINMCDDKVKYCESYGLTIKEEDWPSGIIPARIRCDQGSDFKGEDIYKVCQQLNIERNLEPVATGSMKSLIENSFHLIQQQQRSVFEGIGLITKDWGSKHHKEAMLNIDQFTKSLIVLIICHNKHAMKNYSLTPEQLTAGVKARPVDLWKYYCENVQAPMPISNKEQYLIALMKTGKAYYDKQGVHYLGRTYSVDKDEAPDLYVEMYVNQSKRISIDVKYDPRNMNNLYWINNSQFITFKLNPKKQENIGYENLTEQEMIEFKKKRAELDKQEDKFNNILFADARSNMKAVVNESYTDTLPSDKDMRSARKEEKGAIAQSEYDIASRLGISTTVRDPNVELPSEAKDILITSDQLVLESHEEPESIEQEDEEKNFESMLEALKKKGKEVNKL